MRRLALLALPLLSACFHDDIMIGEVGVGVTSPPDTDGPLSELDALLDQSTACSDTSFHLWSEADQLALSVAVPGLIERAAAAGERRREVLEIGLDDVQVALEHASPVAVNFCTDALSEREVFTTWTATEGGVVVEVDPPADAWGPVMGRVEVWNTLLESDEGGAVFIDTLVLPEISVTRAWGG